jgi:hypothetical protein
MRRRELIAIIAGIAAGSVADERAEQRFGALQSFDL